MNPTPCPICGAPLTVLQLIRGGRYCSNVCAARRPRQGRQKPKHAFHRIGTRTRPGSARDVARRLQANGIQVSHTQVAQHPQRVVWAGAEPVGWVAVKRGRPGKGARG